MNQIGPANSPMSNPEQNGTGIGGMFASPSDSQTPFKPKLDNGLEDSPLKGFRSPDLGEGTDLATGHPNNGASLASAQVRVKEQANAENESLLGSRKADPEELKLLSENSLNPKNKKSLIGTIFESLSFPNSLNQKGNPVFNSDSSKIPIFRNSIEDPRFGKRTKAILQAINHRDDYSRTLAFALTSKYDQLSDEMTNRIILHIENLIIHLKGGESHHITDHELSVVSLLRDIAQYSHADTVDPEDDLTMLKYKSVDVKGTSTFQIIGNLLINIRTIDENSYKEYQIFDLMSMSIIKTFTDRKIYVVYTLDDHKQKLFMIEMDMEDREGQEEKEEVFYLKAYDLSNFEEPASKINVTDVFSSYLNGDNLHFNQQGRFCKTDQGVMVYRTTFDNNFTYNIEILMCTDRSVSRMTIDDKIVEACDSYDEKYYVTLVIFDGGRQIAMLGQQNDQHFVVIAQLKLIYEDDVWHVKVDSISDRQESGLQSGTAFESYHECTEKPSNSKLSNFVFWKDKGSLVTYVDGKVEDVTMATPRLTTKTLEGTPLHYIESEEDFESLNQFSTVKKRQPGEVDSGPCVEEKILCTAENIVGSSSSGVHIVNVSPMEKLMTVEMSSSGDQGYLAVFHRRSKTHFELATVIATNNRGTIYTLSMDGKHLFKATGSRVERYQTNFNDASDSKEMIVDLRSNVQIRKDFELKVEESIVSVACRKTKKQVFTTDLKQIESDDTEISVLKTWLINDASIVYVCYRFPYQYDEGQFNMRVVAFDVDTNKHHVAESFTCSEDFDMMEVCNDMMMLINRWGRPIGVADANTLTRVQGLKAIEELTLIDFKIESFTSLRCEEYKDQRLLYLMGRVSVKNEGMATQHCVLKFIDKKFELMERAEGSDGVFKFNRNPDSSLCVVFNNKFFKIVDMANNYHVLYEKVVVEGILSVALSKIENNSGVVAVFTKTDMVTMFQIDIKSDSNNHQSISGIDHLYTFVMKFNQMVIQASSKFIEPQGYLGITALLGEGKATTRIIDYCKGVMKYELNSEAFDKSFEMSWGAYIFADYELTECALKISIESRYLDGNDKNNIKTISFHEVATRLTDTNRNDTIMHFGLSKTMNKNFSTGDPLLRLINIMNRYTPSQLADYPMVFNLISQSNNDALFDAYVARVTLFNLIEQFRALTWTIDALNLWSRQRVIDSIEDHCRTFGFQHGSIQEQAWQILSSWEVASRMHDPVIKRLVIMLLSFKVNGTPTVKSDLDQDYDTFGQIACESTELGRRINLDSRLEQVKNRLENRPIESMEEYEFAISMTPIIVSPGSSRTSILLTMLNCMTDDDLVYHMRPLVYCMWLKFKPYVVLYNLIYWLKCGLSYAYLGFYSAANIGVAITMIVIDCLLLMFELKCMWSQRRGGKYFKDPWNYLDLCINLGGIVVVSILIRDPESRSLIWLLVRIVLFGIVFMRGITLLRLFKSTRYLITMVLNVFYDMIAFFIILACAVLTVAFGWRITYGFSTQFTENLNDEFPTFYESIYETIMLLYGNVPENEASGQPFNVGRFVTVNIMNIVLSLVFLNLLIAIISQTYTNVEEQKVIHDIRGLLGVMGDFSAFLEGIVHRRFIHRKYLYTLMPQSQSTTELIGRLVN